MYKIEKQSYGYKLTFSGFIKADEMTHWLEDSRKALATAPSKFSALIDMRLLSPLPGDAQELMEKGQKLFKMKGMERSTVAVANAVTKLQFQRIAKDTGIYQWERYIDASSTPNWEQAAVDWITKGVDPDKK